MPDPRYKHGVWQGNPAHVRCADLDSPLAYGWQRDGKSETTGYDLFRLGDALLRCTTPQERFITGHDYLIQLGERVFTALGNLSRITEQVEQLQTERSNP